MYNFRDECMCSFVSPSLEARVDGSYCNVTCSDSSDRVCGDHAHYNVFTTGLKTSKLAGDYYMGCYEESVEHRIFEETASFEFPYVNSPAMCSKYCDKKNLHYYGVTNRNWCWCGNTPPNDSFKKVDDSKCSSQCSGDANKYCGGLWKMAVFHIG